MQEKTWAAQFFDHLALTLLSNKSCTNLSCTIFFIPQKTCIQGLTVFYFFYFHRLLWNLKFQCNNIEIGNKSLVPALWFFPSYNIEGPACTFNRYFKPTQIVRQNMPATYLLSICTWFLICVIQFEISSLMN